MIKNKIKNTKGISLVSLSISIVVLVIITNMIIYYVRDNLKIGNLREMQNDIENLRDKISSFYLQNGTIPAKVEYTNIGNIRGAGVISDAVDTGRFLVIDLSALDNLTLNYGKDYEKIKSNSDSVDVNTYRDLYIINEESHNIFYVQGIKVDNEVFYTDYTADEIDTEAVNLKSYVDGVKIPDGFYYSGGNIDTGLVISDVEGDDLDNSKHGNQFVWVPVPDIDNFKRVAGYISGSKQPYTEDNYSEPYTSGYSTEGAEYDKMVSSVTKNGGFYIGRFEAGKDTNGNVIVQKNADVYNNIKWGNATNNPVEGAVEKAKEFAEQKGYEGVTSTLVYGIQWDATMQFFDNRYIDGIPTQDIPNSYVSYSEGKGNYKDDSTNNPTKTGAKDDYCVKNIYDMAGNVFEWTMEATGSTRVVRGGSYNMTGYNQPASGRVSFIRVTYSSDEIGFRVALYIGL